MADICLKSATCSVFSPHKGAEFTVSAVSEDGAAATKEYTFTLADAEPLPTPKAVPAGCRAQPFSLKFQAPEGLELPQGIYNVSNSDCGSAQIFLVPVIDNTALVPAGGTLPVVYQAVFS